MERGQCLNQHQSAEQRAGFDQRLLGEDLAEGSKLNRTPNRVNRAHWPTKENMQNIFISVCILEVHGKKCLKWHQMGPGGYVSYESKLGQHFGRHEF